MYEIFASLLKEKGVKVTDVVKATGISSSTFTDWKKGRYRPKTDKMLLIATYFGVSVEYLEGKTEERNPQIAQWQESTEYDKEVEINEEPDGQWIPLLGNVAAGEPNRAYENILGYEYIDFQTVRDGQYFALRIAGDSMEPDIKKGSIAIVKHEDTAENGSICIVRINGDESTCKRIQKTHDGIMLISNNPAYEPMYFSAKEVISKPVVIIGRVVEVRTKY